MISQKILIYGAGGAGRELAYTLAMDKERGATWKVEGFIDDTKNPGEIVNDIPVLGGRDYLKNYSGNLAVCIVENPPIKRKLISKIKENRDIKFPVVISSMATVSPYVEWGEGCIVSITHVNVSPNVKLGDFVFVNGGTRIGHDVVIGDYTTLFAGILISGGASIGSDCVIGSGAIIMPKRKIGIGSIIGAGALVSKDIPSRVVAAGVPAKIIREMN
jgi:sugar O-acyltransferase (sialic acid O-acetyltransferase NeuD family)